MKKADIVDAIAAKSELHKGQVATIVDHVFGLIAEALSKGESIDLRGFGTFSVKDVKERQGRNPRDGSPITIPAKRVPGFKPGKELKDKVNVPAVAATPPAA
jgi:nucleoid DNA-binding protein